MRILVALVVTALGGCTQFPDIEAANRMSPATGEPPALLPFAELERATAINTTPPEGLEALEARAANLSRRGARAPRGTAADLAALQARAAILRQPVETFDELEELRARLANMP